MTWTLRVLDLSHHNDGPNGGPIDFAAIRAFGIAGIIHKSSQGISIPDRTYGARRKAALDAGLLWGAYHFADGSDPKSQARHFMQAASPDDSTLMALDYEPNDGNTMNLADARTFLSELDDALGRKAVLYSGNLIKETIGGDADGFFGGHRLWLAQYSDIPKCPKQWAVPWLHQFSGDGTNNHGIRIPGVNAALAGKLDMNSFDGDEDQLTAEWSAGVQAAPVA